jgi:RimJ/RimL family protein N-acetyltransferase
MPDVRLPYEFGGSLRTTRLVLRPMTDADVDDIHGYQSREDVCRYVPFEPRTRDEVAAKVAKYATALTLSGEGDFWQLAIERASHPGRVIGDLYFTIKSTANATGEIGWMLHPDSTGQGYMTEAAGAILEIALRASGCTACAPSSIRATPRRSRSASAWACARRPTSSRTCGSRVIGLTPLSTRFSTASGLGARPKPRSALPDARREGEWRACHDRSPSDETFMCGSGFRGGVWRSPKSQVMERPFALSRRLPSH